MSNNNNSTSSRKHVYSQLTSEISQDAPCNLGHLMVRHVNQDATSSRWHLGVRKEMITTSTIDNFRMGLFCTSGLDGWGQFAILEQYYS